MAHELDTPDITDPRPSRDSGRTRQLTLPAARPGVRLARQATRKAITSWRLAHLEDTAVLLVSELVTNSVRHARPGGEALLTLRLEAAGSCLRIEVHDGDRRWPEPGTPAGLDESGFGFVLVAALADQWGVRDTATGKAVWVELDTRPDGQAGER